LQRCRRIPVEEVTHFPSYAWSVAVETQRTWRPVPVLYQTAPAEEVKGMPSAVTRATSNQDLGRFSSLPKLIVPPSSSPRRSMVTSMSSTMTEVLSRLLVMAGLC
jgi:hypothetical protein